MRYTLRLAAVASLLLVAAGSLHAQNSACREVQFSPEVLSKYPRARDACLDVIQRNGEQYAVFKAQLQEVRGNTLRVRFRNPDGSHGNLMSVTPRSNLKVLIDGKPYPVSELAPNQELTAYVHVKTPVMAFAPADDTEPLEAIPLPAPEETRVASADPEPQMPDTATSLNLVALLGLLCLAIAFALRIVRKRNKW